MQFQSQRRIGGDDLYNRHFQSNRAMLRAASAVRVEGLEERALFSNSVTALTLVNADNDRDLFRLTDGMTINLANLPTNRLNIRADVAGKTRSVVFSLDDLRKYKLENHAPYSIGGDAKAGRDFLPWSLPAGDHSLTATPYLWDNAKGQAGKPLTLNFRVIDVTKPAAPTSLNAAAVSASQIQLNWIDLAANETHYAVLRSVSGGAFEPVARLDANATSFLDTNLTDATAYAYQVFAVNEAGQSTGATIVSATTASKIVPPASPAGLDVVAASWSRVELSWQDAADDETGYLVLRSENGGDYETVGNLPADATFFADESADPDTQYSYIVYATNDAGSSEAISGAVTTPARVVIPASATDFSAVALSASAVQLMWHDRSDDEIGFRLYRSTNNLSFEQIATVGADVETYLDRTAEAGVNYWYSVAPYNVAGEASLAQADDATPSARGSKSQTGVNYTPTLGLLVSPPQAAVDFAIQQPLIRYHWRIAGEAYTQLPGTGEAAMTLALASYAGNTTADARLLQQIRYTITGGNEPHGNGGYPAQHERHMTGAFTLARMTPRIWDQLADLERKKIDLIMKATFIGSVFTTSDNNPFIKAGTQQLALDGDTNLNRGWNPNYREGMIGGVLVGMVYFGGPENASKLLETYDHARFTNELLEYGLTNAHATFSGSYDFKPNDAYLPPTATQIETGVRDYRYLGSPLSDYIGIYEKMTNVTFGKNVNAGINNGAGIDINGDGIGDSGMLVSGQATLPNLGALGMLGEFDSIDANGPRSSAQYSHDGWRIHLKNHIILLAGGYWQSGTPTATNALTRMSVGSTDLWYKLDHGYSNYQKGQAKTEIYYSNTPNHNFELTKPMWEVVKGYHGIA